MAGPLTESEELELLELELEEAQAMARAKPSFKDVQLGKWQPFAERPESVRDAAFAAGRSAMDGYQGSDGGFRESEFMLSPSQQAGLKAEKQVIGTAERAYKNQMDTERRARVWPVEQSAGRAGAKELDQGPVTANPNAAYSEFMLPPDAQRGLEAEREVYRDKGVTSSVDATSIRGLNSLALGIPGIVNKDFRGELAQAGNDQPGASLGGDIVGFLPGSIGIWNAARAPVNAFARQFTPQGGGVLSRLTRYGAPRAGEVGGVAAQNAFFQGAIQEPIRAEQAGEDYTLEGAAGAAEAGMRDPFNLLPLGLSAINRTWNQATRGILTPSAKAADMANRYGVGPRQTTASQGIAQTTQMLGGRLQAADIPGLTNIENALRFALRDNPNIPNANARIADGFQRIRQSLPLEDDPTLNLARLIEREFAEDAPQTRDIIRRFLLKVGMDSPGGGAVVGNAANQIRGQQADILEAEAKAQFGDQPKQDAKKTLETNKKLLGQKGYESALDNLAPDSPGQDAALQRIASREDTQGILFEAADSRGMTVEDYVAQNPLKALHEIRSSLAADARDLRAAGNPDFQLERTVKSMDAVLEQNVPNYKEIRKMYRSEATALDRLGTTRDQRAGADGELKYDPGFGERLLGPGGAAGREEGRATAKSVFDSMDEQSKKAAAISVRDVILDDLGKARAAGVEQRYETAARFQRLNSEGALKALEDVFGEQGKAITKRVRQFIDANEFARNIDPEFNSATMNKAQAMATGAQPFASGLGQRASGASNALSESAIADSVLMLSGAPPIISAMRAPGIIGKMLQPGQRTQQNIAETLLRRGQIGSQVPPRPPGPGGITPIDPSRVPGAAPATNAFAKPRMTPEEMAASDTELTNLYSGLPRAPDTSRDIEIARLAETEAAMLSKLDDINNEVIDMGVDPAILQDRAILPSDVSANAWPRVQELMKQMDDAAGRLMRARDGMDMLRNTPEADAFGRTAGPRSSATNAFAEPAPPAPDDIKGNGFMGFDRPRGIAPRQTRNEPFHDERLTPQENKAVEMRRNGYTTAEAADEMDISEAHFRVLVSTAKGKGVDAGAGTRETVKADILHLKEKGLTSRQIAERTGASPGTVQTVLSQARKAAGKDAPAWLATDIKPRSNAFAEGGADDIKGNGFMGFGKKPSPDMPENRKAAIDEVQQIIAERAAVAESIPVTRGATKAEWDEAVASAESIIRHRYGTRFAALYRDLSPASSGPDSVRMLLREELASVHLREMGLDPAKARELAGKGRGTNAQWDARKQARKDRTNETQDPTPEEQAAYELEDTVPGLSLSAFAESAAKDLRLNMPASEMAVSDIVDIAERYARAYVAKGGKNVTDLERTGHLIYTTVRGNIRSGGLGDLKHEAGQQAILAGVGSIGGSANDLNGDGKKDWKDAAIGAGGALLGGNGLRGAGALKNAFAKDAAGATRTAGAGGRPPKADSPEAIKAAIKDIAKTQPKEPTRLERMVDDGKGAAVPPVNSAPHELDAVAAQAQRMIQRGMNPLDVYDQTRVVFVPYNGGNVPIVSPNMGPEEVIGQFYMWLKRPPAERPEWVQKILADAPRKKGLLLKEHDAVDLPPQPAEAPLPSSGTPWGAIGLGTGLGAASGIPGGALAGYALTRDQQPRNAFARE